MEVPATVAPPQRRRALRRRCVGGLAAIKAGPTFFSSPRRSSACSSSFLGPVVVSLVMSFHDINRVTVEWRIVVWRNYEALLVVESCGLAAFDTLYFTFASVPLGVGVALVGVALALAQACPRFETAYRRPLLHADGDVVGGRRDRVGVGYSTPSSA